MRLFILPLILFSFLAIPSFAQLEEGSLYYSNVKWSKTLKVLTVKEDQIRVEVLRDNDRGSEQPFYHTLVKHEIEGLYAEDKPGHSRANVYVDGEQLIFFYGPKQIRGKDPKVERVCVFHQDKKTARKADNEPVYNKAKEIGLTVFEMEKE